MQTIRCYINHINGYISLGSQRDLILEHIKKKYQVKSNEINDVLGTELTIKGESMTMDYSPIQLSKVNDTYISIRGSKFTLLNPPGKKKIQVIWYFDKPDLGLNGELVNLLDDLQESEEYFTTDYNLPKLLPELGIEKHLLTLETNGDQLADEIIKMHKEYKYSYRKIADEIKKNTGITISRTKVYRTMLKHSSCP